MIACIGGSTTYGYPLSRDESYPKYLADIMGDEVLNLGKCGMQVKDYPKNIEADKIIIAPNWNDIVSPLSDYRLSVPYLFGKNWYRDLKRFIKKYYKNKLVYFLGRVYFGLMRETLSPLSVPTDLSLYANQFKKDLLHIISGYKGKIYFLLMPYKEGTFDIYAENVHYGVRVENKVIRDVASEIGSEVIDLRSLKLNFSDIIHVKSGEDNLKIAREISKYLGG